MNTPVTNITLPNGMAISCLKQDEVGPIYEEVFVRRTYTQHGVTVGDGDVVIDIGANVGLFSLYASTQASDVTIHAFEPLPRVADVLHKNLQAHGVRNTVHQFAVSDTDGPIDIEYYPEYSIMSGLYTNPESDEDITRTVLKHIGLQEHADQILEGRFRRETLRVERRALSTIIREQKIDRVDLLKVDAERAEHEVLAGLSEADWPKIKQLVIEVHDIEGRLASMQADLERRGFKVTREKDPTFVGTEIWLLYATRPKN